MITSPILAAPDPIFAAIARWKEALALEQAAGLFEEMADQASDIRLGFPPLKKQVCASPSANGCSKRERPSSSRSPTLSEGG